MERENSAMLGYKALLQTQREKGPSARCRTLSGHLGAIAEAFARGHMR
jgi:hypothetical protein